LPTAILDLIECTDPESVCRRLVLKHELIDKTLDVGARPNLIRPIAVEQTSLPAIGAGRCFYNNLIIRPTHYFTSFVEVEI
jgi:hypothetical protein